MAAAAADNVKKVRRCMSRCIAGPFVSRSRQVGRRLSRPGQSAADSDSDNLYGREIRTRDAGAATPKGGNQLSHAGDGS